MNPLQRIKSRISSEEDSRDMTEDDIIEIQHRIMLHYGWIPIEEFKKLPIPTFWNLHKCVDEEMRRQMEKEKAMSGMGNIKKPRMGRR